MTYKRLLFLFFACLLGGFTLLQAQSSSPVGVWKTIDDETGEAKSHVEIFEEDGKLYGKIVKLLQASEDTTCDKCPDDKKDQPLIGMVVMWDLETYKDYWSYGEIMDPANGKTYKCSVWLQDNNTLKVRGYIGVSLMGRNQQWFRIK